MTRSLRSGMIPLIDSTKTTGIVFFPGTMVGMLVAGAEPVDAVRLQLILLWVLLGSVALSALIATSLGYRGFFTRRAPAARYVELRAMARRYARWSGIAVAVLFGTGSAIWGLEMPDAGTPVGEVVDFYRDTDDRIVVGGSLSLLGIAAFLLFAAALRRVFIDDGSDEVLASTAFGGAIMSMAAGIGAETINMAAALRSRDDELGDALAQSLFETSQILGSVATAVGLGVFALASGAGALRCPGILPRPVAIVTVVIGVALLTPLSHLNLFPGAALVLLSLMLALALQTGGNRAGLRVSRDSP